MHNTLFTQKIHKTIEKSHYASHTAPIIKKNESISKS